MGILFLIEIVVENLRSNSSNITQRQEKMVA
jgi:hypothetical protein